MQYSKQDLLVQLTRATENGWLEFFKDAALKHDIELPVLLGVASRETGINNILGDHGHGHGLMQLDDRWHKDFLNDPAHKNGLDPASNIDYGASLLRANLDHYHGDYLRALCAYNAGIRGVNAVLHAGKSPDTATTGGDYGSDVIYRSNLFKQLLAEWK